MICDDSPRKVKVLVTLTISKEVMVEAPPNEIECEPDEDGIAMTSYYFDKADLRDAVLEQIDLPAKDYVSDEDKDKNWLIEDFYVEQL